jgi:eukaryotic-like serine/threonine-protein kinase
VYVTDQEAGDTLPGSTLVGRYRIEARIGAGAMGAVYRAEQIGLRRPVALKVLKKQAGGGADVVARFEREAKALSALAHPNTVRVYDFGSTPEGTMFLAMELLEGELATTWLARRGTVETREAIEIVQQVLRSIGEAHDKGIIHRDIKPDNIFLARVRGHDEPLVKVLDFGIAKAMRGDHHIDQFETQDGTVFGTPRYMSPEQAQGKPLDHRSDLYAAGIVLYELLAGAPPFVDKDAVIVMAKHIREEPAPLRRAAPSRMVPASLQEVLDRALAKAPELRFQSALEFERALSRCRREAELLLRTPARGQKLVARALSAPIWAHRAAVITAFALLAASATALVSTGLSTPAAPAKPAGRVEAPAAQALSAGASEVEEESARVTLRSEPAGANVWRQGRFLGVTPLALDVPSKRTLRVQISHEGFEPRTIDLTPAEASRTVELRALAPSERESPALTQDERPRHRRRIPRAPKSEEAYEKF